MKNTVHEMKMRALAAVPVLSMMFASAAFADDIYPTAPDDVSQIVVSNATTRTLGLDLYRSHLTQYWKFDDADNIFSNSVGTLALSPRGSSTVECGTGDNAKIGGGAMFTSDGVVASENVIDGAHPFTIMFWMKRHAWEKNQHTILYIGEKPIKNGERVQDRRFIRISYANLDGGEDQLFFWENQIGVAYFSDNADLGTADLWNHFVITCEQIEQDGAATTNKYTIVLNGVQYNTNTIRAPQNIFAASDYFFIGFGWNYKAGDYSCQNMYFDEIMMFDKALTTDEIVAIKDYTQPAEFAANWHMTRGSGTLDLHGGTSQNVTGYGGTVTTEEGLVLAPERNATYAGVVSGASLTLDAASSSVTQTVAGANAYEGDTHVKTGVLAVNPMAAFPTLETGLVAYWPCDTLSAAGMLADMSGNGNHLYPFVGEVGATITNESCIADGALDLPRKDVNDVGCGFSRNTSNGILEGFTAGEDNSFTVAFWMRIGKAYYREGPFSFGKISSARLNIGTGNTYGRGLYFGDNNFMGSFSIPTSDGAFGKDSKWRHIALAFDKTKADGTQNCFTVYTNGCFAAATTNFNPDATHAAYRFYLGYNHIAGKGIDGALDDVVVLNGVSDADVAALYNWRRGVHEVGGGTSVLPDTTRVVVDAGATLFVTNANERVRSIAGAGTIHVAAGSSLYARSRREFTGTITGGGAFICPGLSIVIQ